MINEEDKLSFYAILAEMGSKFFGDNIESQFFVQTPIIFGDFLKMGAPKEEKLYEDLSIDLKKVGNLMKDVWIVFCRITAKTIYQHIQSYSNCKSTIKQFIVK